MLNELNILLIDSNCKLETNIANSPTDNTIVTINIYSMQTSGRSFNKIIITNQPTDRQRDLSVILTDCVLASNCCRSRNRVYVFFFLLLFIDFLSIDFVWIVVDFSFVSFFILTFFLFSLHFFIIAKFDLIFYHFPGQFCN